jgi:hypothetical protein
LSYRSQVPNTIHYPPIVSPHLFLAIILVRHIVHTFLCHAHTSHSAIHVPTPYPVLFLCFWHYQILSVKCYRAILHLRSNSDTFLCSMDLHCVHTCALVLVLQNSLRKAHAHPKSILPHWYVFCLASCFVTSVAALLHSYCAFFLFLLSLTRILTIIRNLGLGILYFPSTVFPSLRFYLEVVTIS